MNCKIDITTRKVKASHSGENNYFGSIVFETDKDIKWILDFLHHAGGGIAIEGIEIISYDIKDYSIIELNDFVRDGNYFKKIIYNCSDFRITNSHIDDVIFLIDDDNDYLIISDIAAVEIFHSSDKSSNLDDFTCVSLRSESLFEWGASGFLENYIASIASGLTLMLIDKLISVGISIDNIKVFKLPTKIKKILRYEYKINPDSLFLESYHKDKDGTISTVFRNISHRFYLKVVDNELVDIEALKLNKYL